MRDGEPLQFPQRDDDIVTEVRTRKVPTMRVSYTAGEKEVVEIVRHNKRTGATTIDEVSLLADMLDR